MEIENDEKKKLNPYLIILRKLTYKKSTKDLECIFKAIICDLRRFISF